jgi:hypothetical protein
MLRSKRENLENVLDWILAIFVIVPLAIMLALASVCTRESHVGGTCVVSWLEPFFVIMNLLVLLAKLLGRPIYYTAILVSYIGSTVYKVAAWCREGKSAISRKPIGWGIWAISTVVFLAIAVLVIVEIAIR